MRFLRPVCKWHAKRLRIALTVHMPGLLQTEDHARALFAAVIPPLPAADVNVRVAHRIDRKQVLDKPDAPALDLTIHEAALRMQFGGTNVARGQLEHLLHVSERDTVTIRVIPFAAGSFPGAGQSVIYAEGPVPQLDTVELDITHGPEFVSAEMQLHKYRDQLDAMARVALPPKASRDFIRAIAHDL